MLVALVNRLFARLLFAFAAASAAFAAAGVVVPAHEMPVGAPRDHAMPLGAYRFGFLTEPAADHREMAPAMAAVHRALTHAGVSVAMEMPTRETSGSFTGPRLRTTALDPVQGLGLALALLTVLLPRLVRPTRRLLAVLPPIDFDLDGVRMLVVSLCCRGGGVSTLNVGTTV